MSRRLSAAPLLGGRRRSTRPRTRRATTTTSAIPSASPPGELTAPPWRCSNAPPSSPTARTGFPFDQQRHAHRHHRGQRDERRHFGRRGRVRVNRARLTATSGTKMRRPAATAGAIPLPLRARRPALRGRTRRDRRSRSRGQPVCAASTGVAGLVGLDRRRIQCVVTRPASPVSFTATRPVVSGMSGSPLMQGGAAVGVVVVGSGGRARREPFGLAASLAWDLLVRLWRAMTGHRAGHGLAHKMAHRASARVGA
jgi:hypothetical protein